MSASRAEPLAALLQLRWADTDGYGHVNNVTWVRYLEEARIRLFGLPDRPDTADPRVPRVFDRFGSDVFTITAAQRLSYERELPYRAQEIRVEGWVSRIGSSTVDLSFAVWDAGRAERYLVAETVQAVRDRATRGAHRFDAAERAVLEEYRGDPVGFR